MTESQADQLLPKTPIVQGNSRIKSEKHLLFWRLFTFLIMMTMLLSVHTQGHSQQIHNDTLAPAPVHSPKKATLYSAILPGLGQAYNKKYWKIPVIYAGFGTLIYFINFNSVEKNKFADAYKYITGTDTIGTYNDYADKYSEDALLEGRNFYRRNLELSYILSGVLYILNIVDASVDAHFFNYDISDDISLRIKPSSNPLFCHGKPVSSLTIQINLH